MRRTILNVFICVTLGTALGGCASRTAEPTGKSHPNGVVYYDADGNLQQANREAISPEAQDGWETAGTVAGVVLGVAGTALGIVSLTR